MRRAPRHARSRSTSSGRSQRRRHERGYLRHDERTATPENQSERLDRRRSRNRPGRLRAADHRHNRAHRIGRLDAQHQFHHYARSLDDDRKARAGDPRAPASREQVASPTPPPRPRSCKPQPAPGSCHSIGAGLYSRPGSALHPRRAQPGRHPGHHRADHLPGRLDRHHAAAGERHRAREGRPAWPPTATPGPISTYEYDHFVPLELGGAVNDPRNLWPEPGASPNPKDAVEDDSNRKVCDGQMTLAQAQRAIATNWIALARARLGDGSSRPDPPRPPRRASAGSAGERRAQSPPPTTTAITTTTSTSTQTSPARR